MEIYITGNRRALAEGKEASITFPSVSKCFFFSVMGIFHKTLNLALEVLDQSQGSLECHLSYHHLAFIFKLSPVPKSKQLHSKHELN